LLLTVWDWLLIAALVFVWTTILWATREAPKSGTDQF